MRSPLTPSSRSRSLRSLLFLFPLLAACADLSGDEGQGEGEGKQGHRPRQEAQGKTYSTDFSLETPTGLLLLERSHEWVERQVEQRDVYAQPRMCAHNVSYVLEDAGINGYGSYLVPEMVSAAEMRGGRVIRFPRDKAGFIKTLNENYGGRLPLGSLINGCLYEDCGGEGGDGHIAILGETDEDGVVWTYHNNWYRPDNEGGAWRDYMVSKEYYYDLELRRQWMATPWIRIKRGADGLISDVEGLLPALDDLDPFVGFYITATIIPEILEELGESPLNQFTCPSGAVPDARLGFCVDPGGDMGAGNAYGPFTQAMIESCVEAGYGSACERQIELPVEGGVIKVERWSIRVANSLRGWGLCPQGAKLDTDLSRCIEEQVELLPGDSMAPEGSPESTEQEEKRLFVHGPFRKDEVIACHAQNGGAICAMTRWPLWLYEAILDD